MTHLLLNLRHVPDDEIEEVRALLEQHQINYYETAPNRWGISAGAIWIKDTSQLAEAKSLLKVYQDERRQRARDEYAAAVRDGTAETFWQQVRRQPVRLVLILLGIVFAIGLSCWPLLLKGS
jgi:hypothetical protein